MAPPWLLAHSSISGGSHHSRPIRSLSRRRWRSSRKAQIAVMARVIMCGRGAHTRPELIAAQITTAARQNGP